MRLSWVAPLVLLGLSASALASADSPSGLLDRIVAVVDRQPILLSEVRARCKPFLKQIEATYPKELSKRILAEEEARRQILNRMVEEVLIDAEARRLDITVDTPEVDRALETIAASQKITLPQLFEAAREGGFEEKEYREEVSRQVLEGKLFQLLVYPGLKVTPALTETERQKLWEQERKKWIEGLRKNSYVEVRL